MINAIVTQGLIFSLVAMAVYFTSRIINKDDLSVEGSFGLGGAITAVLLEHHVHSMIALAAALALGLAAGLTTGLLYTRLRMNHLMAGLTTTTACFSLSLAIASANKMVSYKTTVFSLLPFSSSRLSEIIIVVGISLGMLVLLRLLLTTEIGLLIRAVGDNPPLVASLGKTQSHYYCLSFALANGLTALAGSLFIQWSGFFSITGSVGVLVTGLSSVMLAELLNKRFGIFLILASILYQAILSASLYAGVMPVWINLTKALIIIALVALSQKINARRKGDIHAEHH